MNTRHRGLSKTTAAVMILAAIVLLFLPGNSTGGVVNKTVDGMISYQSGDPVAGASVRVEIWGGYWPSADYIRITVTTVSDGSGYYQVTISSNYWDPHNTIKVNATLDPYCGASSVEANEEEYQTVDVTLQFLIPEFGGASGLPAVVIGFIASVSVLAASRRKRSRG